MTTSIPKPFTLSIAVGDSINRKGVIYTITNVGAGVDNGNGVISYAVTISTGEVLTCTANDTVLSSANNGGVSLWVRSGY